MTKRHAHVVAYAWLTHKHGGGALVPS